MKALVILLLIVAAYAPAAGHPVPVFDRITIPRMELYDAPVVPVPIEAWLFGAEAFVAGYGTVGHFVSPPGYAPGPRTTLLGAHMTGAFMRLPMLIPGDRIILSLRGASTVYRVRFAGLFAWPADPHFNYDGLVLATCTTAGQNLVWTVLARRELE